MTKTIAILGAGAWGTALAAHLARRNDVGVTLWARSAALADEIAIARRNERYLSGVVLSDRIAVGADLAEAAKADLLIAATPVAALSGLADALAAARAFAPLVWLSKGFVEAPPSAEMPAGIGLAHQVLAARWPAPVGIVSGPSFAEEVARGMPTAVTVAATDPGLASEVA